MEIFKRALFTLVNAWQHHADIKRIRQEEAKYSIADIDLSALKNTGINVLVLDFDGVLASHGLPKPNNTAVNFLRDANSTFANSVFILSNKPSEVRRQYFAEHFPNVHFIHAKKKPYPDGMLHILKKANCAPQEAILIDDRLLTGALATILSGTKCLYVSKPYIDFKNHFVIESLFQFFRVVERCLF